jgi:hypothetical protein
MAKGEQPQPGGPAGVQPEKHHRYRRPKSQKLRKGQQANRRRQKGGSAMSRGDRISRRRDLRSTAVMSADQDYEVSQLAQRESRVAGGVTARARPPARALAVQLEIGLKA